jgi:formamidopyrimidine-DNA glycosylase
MSLAVPELPEVEVARRLLASVLQGGRVERVEVRDRMVAAGAEAAGGRDVARVERRGKRLRIGLVGGGALFAHLGMSGRWLAVEPGSPGLPYERARIIVRRKGRAYAASYADPRRLGRVRFAAEDPASWLALGPDALEGDLDARSLHARLLARRSRPPCSTRGS